jgi:uncharacterized membrane protein
MNRMLIVVFDNETAAETGTRAMKRLDFEGRITVYAMGVIAKDADGKVSIKQTPDQVGTGTGVGLAVGSLIGLLGGPVGLAVGAVTGTLVGALRDYWVAGVGLDFIDEATSFLTPGKAALVAEIDEDSVNVVDAAMEASAGMVFRRTRADLIQVQYEQDIVGLTAELVELEGDYLHATSEAKIKLQAKMTTAKAKLEETMQRANDKFKEIKLEVDAKIKSVEDQIAKAEGDLKTKLEDRMKLLRSGYAQRSDKLQQAWGLTKEALAA